MAITKLPRNAIADNAINADKIEDGTVAVTEISGTVSAAKLNSTLDISGKTVTLPNTSVTSDMISGTIANAKLSNSSITVRGTARNLGDTFTIGTDVDWQAVKTSGFTAAASKGYFVNTTSGAVTVTLPSSASIGDTIAIKDYAGTFATNNLTIARNGHNIQGTANNSEITTNRASLVLVYVDATKGWLYAAESNVADLQTVLFISATGGTVATSGDFKIHSFTGDGNFVVANTGNAPIGGPASVDYLVVAGGAGASGNGGGGAGGFRTSYPSPAGVIPVSAQTYPITVGGAGAAGSPTGSIGGNGSNSVFSTITSAGGGGGSRGGNGACVSGNGANGGSGGGATFANSGPTGAAGVAGTGNTPPVSPSQGNNGGIGGGTNGTTVGAGGGGGGAGGVGGNSPTPGPGPFAMPMDSPMR